MKIGKGKRRAHPQPLAWGTDAKRNKKSAWKALFAISHHAVG